MMPARQGYLFADCAAASAIAAPPRSYFSERQIAELVAFVLATPRSTDFGTVRGHRERQGRTTEGVPASLTKPYGRRRAAFCICRERTTFG